MDSVWVLLVCPGLLCFAEKNEENVAFNKSAWQKYLANNLEKFSAERAVDGVYSELSLYGGHCTMSEYGHSTATWHVDLGKVHKIAHIVMYFPYENLPQDRFNGFADRCLGFSVYISNTTDKEDGELCFVDTNYTIDTLPNPVNINTQISGRYVIYYNNRTHPPFPADYHQFAFSDLCEVQVYECKFGWFGPRCERRCNKNCGVPGRCDWITGQCEGGCQAGWETPECDKKCDEGKFGLGCTEFCGNCSLIEIEEMEDGKCRHVDGFCKYGCNPGYYGDRCLKHCPNGFYGDMCSLKCPGNCTYCHIEYGVCDECYPGFTGLNCMSTCAPGRYGINCYERCSPFCKTHKCDHITGACEDGCEDGWGGMQCEQYLDGYDENRLPEDISAYLYIIKGTIIAAVINTGIFVVYIIFLRRRRLQNLNINRNSLNEVAFKKDENLCFSAITHKEIEYQKL